MRPGLLVVTSVAVCLLLTEALVLASTYGELEDEGLEDYTDSALERFLQQSQKRASLIHLNRRSCIRRGGNCEHRPRDCCYNSSCRCNLWGTNCRCQRMGLFQKWGK